MSSREYDSDRRFVCVECFLDEGIRASIEGAMTSNECSFCGTVAEEAIAAPFKEVAAHINSSLYQEYDDAANWLSYDSSEGGYLGTTWDTWELLVDVIELELPRDQDDKLFDALRERLDDNVWCERDPYSLNYAEHTRYSWEWFCRVVKHKRRYFFADSEDSDGEVLSPAELLQTILDYAENVDLIVRHEPGTLRLFRARYQREEEKWVSPIDLGPPPIEKATQSNRMSPAGVVMFYASDNDETALRETALSQESGTYAIGTVVNTREILMLDLANLPPIPSLFAEIPDSLEYNPRPVLQFLHHVSWEMSQPVIRDGREHIEYVPSQVVTEFIRSRGLARGNVDGIKYPSAVHEGNVSYVLFADQDNVALPEGQSKQLGDEDRWLQLVALAEHLVTEDELARWRNDCAISPLNFGD